MADALKIGIAGLGTVGASLVKILTTRSNLLTIACGRLHCRCRAVFRAKNMNASRRIGAIAAMNSAISCVGGSINSQRSSLATSRATSSGAQKRSITLTLSGTLAGMFEPTNRRW